MNFFRFLLLILSIPLLSQAQTIGLNQTVAAEFNSVAEFQSLSAQGWIFRPGSGTGASTCATPGVISTCGFGFANDGALGVARANAQSNPEGRWIVTPPIIFGNSGTVTFVLRKVASGQGGVDVRESGGGSDTQDMAKSIDGMISPIRGSTPCAPGAGSFCPERNIRTSGPATSGNEPNCANLFGVGSDGVGLTFCTVVIRATELQNFGTGVHRLAFKLRSTSAVNPNYQDMLLDRIVISTGNNDTLPAQGFVINSSTGSTLQRGLSRHPILSWSAATIMPVGASADVAYRMDFAPDGSTLYGIANVGGPERLVRINPLDASVTTVADLTGYLFAGEFAQTFSIDPLTGQAIVIGRNFNDLQSRLYFLNLSSGVLELQAGINGGADFKASAIAIDCQGRLFSVETSNPSGSGRLYRIDRVTGNVTLIGNTSYLSTIAHGPIDFDNASGRLYGWVTAQSGAYTGYGSYALNTGTFSVLANTPSALVTGGAFSSKCWAAFRSGFEN